MIRVSVLTPTHNRSEKLKRLYLSLEKSTFRDFEWVIVNDGSSDDTESVVSELIEKATFPVTYCYQENAGKHVAMNRLYDLAKGEYAFQIDDDDELLFDAMEKGLAIWDGMEPSKREQCWCVCGRHTHYKTGKMLGDPFPSDINYLPLKKKKKVLASLKGDKCGMQKISLVRQFKFPEVKGCNFFPEIYLWRQLNSLYKQYYVNEFFGICHTQEGESLMNHSHDLKSYYQRYKIYEYLLSPNCSCRSSFFSRLHFVELYCFHKFADSSEIGSRERYVNISRSNRLMLVVMKIPYLLYKKIKNK